VTKITSAAATVVLALSGVLLAGGARPAGAASGIVQIHDFGFVPKEMHIGAGDSVVWSNTGEVSHAVSFDGPGTGPSSDQLGSDEGYVHAFDQPGSYAYHCRLHPMMTGLVLVGEKGSEVTPAPPAPSARRAATPPSTPVETPLAPVRVANPGQPATTPRAQRPVEISAARRILAAKTEPSAKPAASASGQRAGETALGPPSEQTGGPHHSAAPPASAARPAAVDLRPVDTGSPKVIRVGIMMIASGLVWLAWGLRRRSCS
jgi:plastocyanin